MSVDEQIIGKFVISLKTTGDRCLILLPCSPGSLTLKKPGLLTPSHNRGGVDSTPPSDLCNLAHT